MNWLDYTIRPEKIYEDFAPEIIPNGGNHSKYSIACELLQNLANVKNIGTLTLNESISLQLGLSTTDFPENEIGKVSDEFTESLFGPSTPESPRPSKYLENSENSPDINFDSEKSSKYFDKPIYQFSMFRRDINSGLPYENISSLLSFINQNSLAKKRSLRFLNISCELIRLVRIDEPEIEENVHSAVRHVLFMYLLESSDPNSNRNVFNKDAGFVLRSLEPENPNRLALSKFSQYLYHRWIVRSFYRENSMSFDFNKSFSDQISENVLDENSEKLFKFLMEKDFSNIGISFFSAASSFYDLGRFYFSKNKFGKALLMFEKSLNLDVSISSYSNQTLARINCESGSINDYVLTCKKITNINKSINANQYSSNNVYGHDIQSQNTFDSSLEFFNNSRNVRDSLGKSTSIIFPRLNENIVFSIPIESYFYSSLENFLKNGSKYFLDGVFFDTSSKITEISYLNSIYSKGIDFLYQEKYYEASIFFITSTELSKNNEIFSFPRKNLLEIIPDHGSYARDIEKLSNSYLNLAKALLSTQKFFYQNSSYDLSTSQAVMNNTITSFYGSLIDLKLESKETEIVPLKFLYLERLALSSMCLNDQELFVFIIERVALNPQLHRQIHEPDAPQLKVYSGLFFLKNIFSKYGILNFGKRSIELQYNLLYKKFSEKSLSNTFISDVRAHYLRILDNLLILSDFNGGEFDFTEFFSHMNDLGVWIMLCGLISGTVFSIIPMDSDIKINNFDSFGVLHLFSLDDASLKIKMGSFGKLSSIKNFNSNKNNEIYRKTNLLPIIITDLNATESDKSVIDNGKSNQIFSPKGIAILRILSILNNEIIKFCHSFVPSILLKCDLLWTVSRLKINEYNLFNYPKPPFPETIIDIPFTKKYKSRISNSTRLPKRPLFAYECTLDPVSGHSNSTYFSKTIKNCNIKIFVREFLEYIYAITEGFNPIYLVIILSQTNNVSRMFPNLPQSSSAEIFINDENPKDIPIQATSQIAQRFLIDRGFEISMIRHRLPSLIESLKADNLPLCVSALLQFPQYNPRDPSFELSPQKVAYQDLFCQIDHAILMRQFSFITCSFLWDFSAIQYANFSLRNNRENSISSIEKNHHKNVINPSYESDYSNSITKTSIFPDDFKNSSLQSYIYEFGISQSLGFPDSYFDLNKDSPLKNIDLSFIPDTRAVEEFSKSYDYGNINMIKNNYLDIDQFDLFDPQQALSFEDIFDYKLSSVKSLFDWMMLHYTCKN
ncbi:hypothetical protein AYI68_g200 [Smittium mucronatum]|uniref:Uncharacterized protein n=1 Tax=Smittium mucronatum TaxID=133383 RepID=A0A1R0H915_9FUNG|nr:hypothetical protein AYI68_g200 [Smittium mucronatum]